ncbi:MAG: LPS assembly lipoprotein LptE [Proteobacteria bacterium]|nr:LPS assembly lipoprotein LptE [Pseudomonadota bacterium]
MSSRDAIAALRGGVAFVMVAALALALGGCGFHPLYGEMREGAAPAELAEIKIGPLYDRRGQILRNELLTALTPKGAAERPRYLLRVTFTDSVEELGIGRDQFATRGNLRLNLTFSLVDQVANAVVFSGGETRIASFNVVRSQYATEAARDDAFVRAAEGVAQDMRTRIAVFFLDRASRAQAARAP